jgi:glycosyltransferase involved in cell wall biosynthesis
VNHQYWTGDALTRTPEFICLEACNFVDYPLGGTLTFATQMLTAFGNRMALAGIVTDATPCGRWIKREIHGVTYDFFGVCQMRRRTAKPVIPARVVSYLALRRKIEGIKSLGVDCVFTQTPQFMLLLNHTDWRSICFCFAGTGNSVGLSRYPLLRMFGQAYERRLLSSLNRNADRILAAADDRAIEAMTDRSGGVLRRGAIAKLPTRYDDAIFHQQDRSDCRRQKGLPAESTIIAVNGRLCWVKGWRFVIESFFEYLKHDPAAIVLFIGDGEDRQCIEATYSHQIKLGQIRITGRVSPIEVSMYLGASDAVMIGSHEEGWPTAMVEALACCRPIVSTDVGGARDMIVPGENGFILPDRDPTKAAIAIGRALKLANVVKTSQALRQAYGVSTLAPDLETLWLRQSL